MLTLGAMPRVPADELLVYALGEDHERVFREAYDATHDYLQHLGARMAHSKSYTFSTVRQTRRKLRQHLWRGVNATIKVVSNVRDLGSHLNVASGMFGTTINGRINEAIETIKRIAHTPYDYAKKAMLIRTNAHAKASYGVEAAPACDAHMAHCTSAVAGAIAPSCKQASNAITTAVGQRPRP